MPSLPSLLALAATAAFALAPAPAGSPWDAWIDCSLGVAGGCDGPPMPAPRQQATGGDGGHRVLSGRGLAIELPEELQADPIISAAATRLLQRLVTLSSGQLLLAGPRSVRPAAAAGTADTAAAAGPQPVVLQLRCDLCTAELATCPGGPTNVSTPAFTDSNPARASSDFVPSASRKARAARWVAP